MNHTNHADREWRLHASMLNPKQEETRSANQLHRKHAPQMIQEYARVLNADGPVENFEQALKDSIFLRHTKNLRAGNSLQTGVASARFDVTSLSSDRTSETDLLDYMPAAYSASRNEVKKTQRRIQSGTRCTEPSFLGMPPFDYLLASRQLPGPTEARQEFGSVEAQANGIVENFRLPGERLSEAQRLDYEEKNPIANEILVGAFYDHLQTLSTRVKAQLRNLEIMFEQDAHDLQSPKKTHAQRDLRLNLGAKARSMFEHFEARKSVVEASDCYSRVSNHSTELDYSLLAMTSEWERTEHIMNKMDGLLKSFDNMANKHLLVDSGAFRAIQQEPVCTSNQGSPSKGVASLNSQHSSDGISTKIKRQGARAMPFSPPPSLLDSVRSDSTRSKGNRSPSKLRSVPPPVSRAELLASWMEEHGIQIEKSVFHADKVDRIFMSSDNKEVDGEKEKAWGERSKESSVESGIDDGASTPQHVILPRQADLEWHFRGDITRNVKQARNLLSFASVGTQFPNDDQARTLQNRLMQEYGFEGERVPKIIHDFAVRELVFPPEWVPFVRGIPADMTIAPWDAPRVNQALLEIYYQKLLLDEESRQDGKLYTMSLHQHVVFYMLEEYEFVEAKGALRNFLYGLLQHYGLSDRFRLFLRFCGVQDLLPEYYLEHYLRFLVECIPHVLKPSDPKGEFAAMTSQGRDFVSVEDVEGISERFCRSAVASVRRLAFANKLHSVRVYQIKDKKRSLDLVDVEHLWLLLLIELQDQHEQAREEAGQILVAADVDKNGKIDLDEFVDIVKIFDESLSREQIGKMYMDLVVESGSDLISCDAFLRIGEKYNLLTCSKTGLEKHHKPLLRAQQWRRLALSVHRDGRQFSDRLNLFSNTVDNEDLVQELDLCWQALNLQVEFACKDLDTGQEVRDPTGAWQKYHHVQTHLSRHGLNHGINSLSKNLKIIGSIKPHPTRAGGCGNMDAEARAAVDSDAVGSIHACADASGTRKKPTEAGAHKAHLKSKNKPRK